MAGYCEPIRFNEWHEPDPELSWAEPHEGEGCRERQARLTFAAALSAARKARSVAAAKAQEQLVPLYKRFQEQAEKWERETGHLSSPTQRMMHPSYQAILGMGREHEREMVVLLIRDMQRHCRPWFGALSYLTRENPIDRSDAGKMNKMIASWVEWGKSKGLL